MLLLTTFNAKNALHSSSQVMDICTHCTWSHLTLAVSLWLHVTAIAHPFPRQGIWGTDLMQAQSQTFSASQRGGSFSHFTPNPLKCQRAHNFPFRLFSVWTFLTSTNQAHSYFIFKYRGQILLKTSVNKKSFCNKPDMLRGATWQPDKLSDREWPHRMVWSQTPIWAGHGGE